MFLWLSIAVALTSLPAQPLELELEHPERACSAKETWGGVAAGLVQPGWRARLTFESASAVSVTLLDGRGQATARRRLEADTCDDLVAAVSLLLGAWRRALPAVPVPDFSGPPPGPVGQATAAQASMPPRRQRRAGLRRAELRRREDSRLRAATTLEPGPPSPPPPSGPVIVWSPEPLRSEQVSGQALWPEPAEVIDTPQVAPGPVAPVAPSPPLPEPAAITSVAPSGERSEPARLGPVEVAARLGGAYPSLTPTVGVSADLLLAPRLAAGLHAVGTVPRQRALTGGRASLTTVELDAQARVLLHAPATTGFELLARLGAVSHWAGSAGIAAPEARWELTLGGGLGVAIRHPIARQLAMFGELGLSVRPEALVFTVDGEPVFTVPAAEGSLAIGLSWGPG